MIIKIDEVYRFGQNEFIIFYSQEDYVSIYFDYSSGKKRIRRNLYSDTYWPKILNQLSILKDEETKEFIIFGLFSYEVKE